MKPFYGGGHKPLYRDWVIILSTVITAVLLAGVAWLVYLVHFDDNPPVTFNELPFPVEKAVYHTGEPIVATLDFCRYTDVGFTAHNSFVNELIYALPSFTASGAQQGCHKIQARLSVIPVHLPPGRYRLMGRNVYCVNVLACRTVEWSTVEFTIINDDWGGD